MLYNVVIVFHVIACFVLILVILLQAGRGGGLSEAFGGGSTQSIFGTKTNVFLTRATTACAVMFIVTCLVLGILTSRRGKSLISLRRGIPEGQDIPATRTVGDEMDLDQANESLPDAEPQNLPAE